MKSWCHVFKLLALAIGVLWTPPAMVVRADEGGARLSVNPNSLSFSAIVNGAAPPAQTVSVTASRSTRFSVATSVQSGGRNWLTVSPTGTSNTNQTLTVSVNPSQLAAGTYDGTITVDSSNSRAVAVAVQFVVSAASALAVSPASLSFSATVNGSSPASQRLSVTAPNRTAFTATASVQSGGRTWLSISPSGSLSTNQTLTVSARLNGLTAGNYSGTILLAANGRNLSVPVTFSVATSGGGGGTGGGGIGAFKLIGWNDLGMHCQDGKDFSVFAVLPPFNTIHAHLIDGNGRLVISDIGYTVTYEAINDPLTNTRNTTSSAKTNFWQFASALGFGALAPDMGLKGFAMPGAANTPQAMTFTTSDNTWLAEGIPIMPYADAAAPPYPLNYLPMMRLKAKNSLGTVLATTDIVLPVSDEMTCSVCHASGTGTTAARPAIGWVNNPDLAKDIKLNILRKHDDRFASTSLFQTAASQTGISAAGLEASSKAKPFLCASCHGSNALGLAGVGGVQSLTTAMHASHASAVDPVTNATMDSSTVRDACYRCHPGPNTKCLRGAMSTLKTSTGANAVECQSCHGTMNTVAVATRSGWLDEPNCQSCHTGTATQNNGQIAYTSVYSSGTIVRNAVNQTFATNPNTPAPGISLYRFSKGHGGLQCEACHGATHAEYATPSVNDNVQSTALQGHTGMLAECTACHASTPNTVNGGPHGLHPIGSSWVNGHQNAAESNRTACQACHGTDYRGTILSKMQADRTMAGRSFARGTIIGCYNCHNGPKGD